MARTKDLRRLSWARHCLFVVNLLFWGLSLLSVWLGLYIHHDRTVPILGVVRLTFDPASLLIVGGFTVFVITTFGCVGTLRDNICLLRMFAFSLLACASLFVCVSILILTVLYTYPNAIVNPGNLLQRAMERYTEDLEWAAFIDSLQINFHCCGIGVDGYKDWTVNPYFACYSDNPSPQRCSVPYSCCHLSEGNPVNLLCGMGSINKTAAELKDQVHTVGCLIIIQRMVSNNAIVLGLSALAIAVPLLLGAFLAARVAHHVVLKGDVLMSDLLKSKTAVENEISESEPPLVPELQPLQVMATEES